ncbi:superoxide dismutase family protein [Sphingomonas canadensis]|uniref:Superoxide dismutase family protein n=1 Tax=Sphingomonas canadensis TaxID=1219257 RepID=A0ABW3H9S9_9SPHN|nr:superoxide dismutase family protein [Sphingomonas canadensis]MCW3837341.1 superoxide dismutase family protein [Sphingomonas canadensis]
MRAWQGLAAVAGMALLAGCSGRDGAVDGTPPPEPAPGLVAGLWTGKGVAAGVASATEVPGGVRIQVEAEGLTPGPHGVHVHMAGKCDAPDFASAGGHWNPSAKQHGAMNPMGPHVGDMPNLIAGADGKGTLSFVLAGATIAGLADADGAALIVHAGEDDLKTDPSGNSGGRFACGVLETPNGG